MPASGFLFAQGVILLMLIATLVIGGIARLFGRSATALMAPVAVVFAISLPFLFAWRPAEAPGYSDALLGCPQSPPPWLQVDEARAPRKDFQAAALLPSSALPL